jgi:hypothetical protein
MSDDNKALLRRFYDEIFTKKNADAIDEICRTLSIETRCRVSRPDVKA